MPPAGFEPALLPPEGSALSPELRGPGTLVEATRGFAACRRPDLAGTAGDQYPHPVGDSLGRVLVVEDDEVIRSLIALNLDLEGFEVTTAVDGAQALTLVKTLRPLVVTLDAMMPNIDGYEVVVRFRADPDTAHVKVLMVSARAQQRDLQRATRAGVDGYLTKPFDPAELVTAVRRLAGLPA